MPRLAETTALITGGGSGIGAAIAHAFAAEGCRVAVCSRRAERLGDVTRRAPMESGGTVVGYAADVSDRADVSGLFAWAVKELGHIDILVNSAGINVRRRAIQELSPEDWDRILQVNVTGAYNCIREVLPQMRQRHDGLIINVCSVAGLRTGLLGGVAYNASKFAMSALGRTIGEEERLNGIRVTTIYPGEVDTPILEDRPVPVTLDQRALMLQPEDVAATALMVACLPGRARVPELVVIPTTQSFT